MSPGASGSRRPGAPGGRPEAAKRTAPDDYLGLGGTLSHDELRGVRGVVLPVGVNDDEVVGVALVGRLEDGLQCGPVSLVLGVADNGRTGLPRLGGCPVVAPVTTPDMSAASAAGDSPRVHPQATLKVPGPAFSIVSGAPLAEHSIALQTTAVGFNIRGHCE